MTTTTFNPESKPILSYGEALGPAMKITDAEDAAQYLAAYVAYLEPHVTRDRTDGKTAAEIARINLGYYAGYYDSKTRERVERLFSCAHPIFGKASGERPMTDTIPENSEPSQAVDSPVERPVRPRAWIGPTGQTMPDEIYTAWAAMYPSDAQYFEPLYDRAALAAVVAAERRPQERR